MLSCLTHTSVVRINSGTPSFIGNVTVLPSKFFKTLDAQA